ncbi:lysosomal thioesterase PPT2 homolog [Schistocerca serialis cubense]|uniref:lysosomal thioesterase PPT2 homolog n=1 Tax=Schistocerca serialis cubense TaxID=2023355 RepID=UPI00214EC118|nr:lysosomal thioesterase PPT2 homolog [Schistocerca serialis cubense]
MHLRRKLTLILSCYLLFATVSAYKPLIIMHGILTGRKSMVSMAEHIQEAHPGTEITIINKYAAWESLAPMWHQVVDVGREIMKISAAHPDGINLIGYSQGGLIARAILQQFPNHNVKTFISLSSPQAGQYGTQFLHLFFPNLVRETAYELFYSSLGQHTSVGNYWNDPYHKELYYNYSKFLPYINNELESPYSSQYKYGLTKLDNLVLIGGPDDGVITPWESSHFGYYGENGSVIDMRKQPAYVNDTLGLQTLDLKGKLLLIKIHGVSHLQWHRNATVIDKFLLPFLD